jgi:HAMP domain-containing protein
MKIRTKLVMSFITVALLAGLIGYTCVSASQKVLEETIGENSVLLASRVMGQINEKIRSRTEIFQEYARDMALQSAVMQSNRAYGIRADRQEYIDRMDQQWISTAKEELTPFMQELLNNALSKALVEKAELYKDEFGNTVFGEVFVTNRYGATVASTGRTSDFRQDDEQWWQIAKEKGLYLGDVEFDESACVTSIPIGIRVNGKGGKFIGVVKTVLIFEDIAKIVKEASGFVKYRTAEFGLVDKNGSLICSSSGGRDIFNNISAQELDRISQSNRGYFIRSSSDNKNKRLLTFINSKGHKDIGQLGWSLVVEYQTDEIFASVRRLRKMMLIVSAVLTGLALFFGLFISHDISVPITKLRAASKHVCTGDLNFSIDIKSKDEIGELADSFEKMTEYLRKTTTSMDNLECEIAERKTAEQKFQQKIEELRQFVNVASGRELKMIELKKEIDVLLEELGRVPKYKGDIELIEKC